jgi:hypothetical protein
MACTPARSTRAQNRSASANAPAMRQSAPLSTQTKDPAMKLARLRRRRNRLRRDLRTRGKL